MLSNVDFSHKVEAAETWRGSKDFEFSQQNLESCKFKATEMGIQEANIQIYPMSALVDFDTCDVSHLNILKPFMNYPNH